MNYGQIKVETHQYLQYVNGVYNRSGYVTYSENITTPMLIDIQGYIIHLFGGICNNRYSFGSIVTRNYTICQVEYPFTGTKIWIECRDTILIDNYGNTYIFVSDKYTLYGNKRNIPLDNITIDLIKACTVRRGNPCEIGDEGCFINVFKNILNVFDTNQKTITQLTQLVEQLTEKCTALTHDINNLENVPAA